MCISGIDVKDVGVIKVLSLVLTTVMGSDNGSDFGLTNFAFVPPSPPQLSAPLTSPPLHHTSSYNGSYYSPYSQHSELSFSGDDIQLQDIPIPMNEYEPLDYDAPNQPASLLMFTNDSDYMSPDFSLNNNRSTRSPFDHSSSSNANGADENNITHLDDIRRSRPSSVASNYTSPALPSPGQPTFDSSPRIPANFGNMSVHTPNWNTPPLHQISPNLNSQIPLPVHKPHTSPRLLTPDDQQQQQQQQNIPIINAPHGDDDMMGGPQLCIEPATPVSGGGAGSASAPFQVTPSQGPESYDQPSQHRQRDSSPSRFPVTEENNAVASSRLTPNNDTTNLPATSNLIFSNDHSQRYQQQQQQSRPRTYSDSWNLNPFSVTSGLENGNAGNGVGGYDYQRQQLQTFTFGGTHGGSTTSGNGFLSPDSHLLRRSVSDSPRHHRHSRSEDIRSPPMHNTGNNNNGLGRGYHHQQSHSIGGTTAASNFLFPPNVDFHTGQQQQYLHPSQPHSLSLLSAAGSASNPNLSLSSSDDQRSFSPGRGHFRRASSATRSDRGAEVWGSLGTQGTLTAPRRMNPYPSPNVSPRVKYTDLELDSELTLGNGDNNGESGSAMGLGLGMGDLGEPPVSAGFSDEVGLSRRGSYAGLDTTIVGAGGSQKAESVISAGERSQSRQSGSNVPSGSQTDLLPAQVPKVNVTTGRTATASHRRRKQVANFACPVAGCGSTFTRSFNLKGHLRSHFEEKPYKCHWPGCEKGFARQHDCKRHEQLHSNFRPFECEGCRKQFARMDALNRHLRSEAGVECARFVERGKGSGDDVMGDMESVYDMNGMTMSMTRGMVELGMKSEEQQHPIPKKRQTGWKGGGADNWSGVAL